MRYLFKSCLGGKEKYLVYGRLCRGRENSGKPKLGLDISSPNSWGATGSGVCRGLCDLAALDADHGAGCFVWGEGSSRSLHPQGRHPLRILELRR